MDLVTACYDFNWPNLVLTSFWVQLYRWFCVDLSTSVEACSVVSVSDGTTESDVSSSGAGVMTLINGAAIV